MAAQLDMLRGASRLPAQSSDIINNEQILVLERIEMTEWHYFRSWNFENLK